MAGKRPLSAKNPEERQTFALTLVLSFLGFFASIWMRSKSVGQSLSALCTSSLENVATVRGLHSLSEAMLLLSLALLRLVSSEHFGIPPSRFAVGAIFLPV